MVCDGAGSTQQAADANDIEDDANPCTIDWCNAGTPTHDAVAVGTRCNTTGYCDAQKRCVACLAPSDCGTATDCATPTCNNGVCGTNFTLDGTPIGTQTAGDCKRKVCDGAGAVSERADNADLPNDNNTCTADTCGSGAPVFTPTPNQACGTNGICSQQGQCVGCNAATDCTGTDDFCKTRTCLNNVCGVSYTPSDMPLPTQTTGDCATRVCDGQGGTRANPAPTDVYVDGNPCTLDQCAGTVPQNPPTPAGATCNVSGGKVCNGAGACVACLTPADCANPTGFPCVIATCSSNQCATASATRDTPCGPGPSCSSGVAQLQDKCIDGTCTDSGSQTCSPYVCGPSACTTSCVGDGGCSGGTSCDTGLGVCITGQKCTDYCNAMASTCTATNLQYATPQACLRTCAKIEKGAPSDGSGNTLGCRMTHEVYARSPGAADVHCAHAGPAGAGGCGTNCDSFCALALALCPGTYASDTVCKAECGGFSTTPLYNAGITTGNNFACRLYQLTHVVTQDAAYCPLITAASTVCR